MTQHQLTFYLLISISPGCRMGLCHPGLLFCRGPHLRSTATETTRPQRLRLLATSWYGSSAGSGNMRDLGIYTPCFWKSQHFDDTRREGRLPAFESGYLFLPKFDPTQSQSHTAYWPELLANQMHFDSHSCGLRLITFSTLASTFQNSASSPFTTTSFPQPIPECESRSTPSPPSRPSVPS